MHEFFRGLFVSQSREIIPPDLSIPQNTEALNTRLSIPVITVRCVPVRCNRDPGEKASQPFLFKMVGIPHMNDFLAMTFGHRNKNTSETERRRHTYKIDRVLHKENGIELRLMEEPMLMEVLRDT